MAVGVTIEAASCDAQTEAGEKGEGDNGIGRRPFRIRRNGMLGLIVQVARRLTWRGLIAHMHDMAKTTIRQVTATGRAIGRSFARGIGDCVTLAGEPRARPFPATQRSPSDALRKDWEKLGGDMDRATDKVREPR